VISRGYWRPSGSTTRKTRSRLVTDRLKREEEDEGRRRRQELERRDLETLEREKTGGREGTKTILSWDVFLLAARGGKSRKEGRRVTNLFFDEFSSPPCLSFTPIADFLSISSESSFKLVDSNLER